MWFWLCVWVQELLKESEWLEDDERLDCLKKCGVTNESVGSGISVSDEERCGEIRSR